ncbi:MAG: GNAT family N-acetyltransferase [Halobacteriota archaeon]|uniref:GNAT family N-acetyltransferase n=1 Tax=Natronomonas sp. TaxID=2184060 RepID=UPI003976B15B
MIRPIEPSDHPMVQTLQTNLTYADPTCLDAAINGPFLGRVATNRGRVIGYAVAFPGDPATLSELVVAPDVRREGYGRQLVESIVSATAAERTVVTTPIENREARRFYATLGFEREKTLVGFYADGTDALRLARRE